MAALAEFHRVMGKPVQYPRPPWPEYVDVKPFSVPASPPDTPLSFDWFLDRREFPRDVD